MNFFQRLLAVIFSRKPPQSNILGTASGLSVPTESPHPPPASAIQTTLPTIGARCPMISNQGEIIGFEFRIGEDVQRRMNRRANHAAWTAYAHAVLSCAHLISQSGRVGLARLPAVCLAHLPSHQSVTGVWIAVDQTDDVASDPALVQTVTEALQQLRTQGAKVSWDAKLVLALTPDFVWVRQDGQSMPVVLASLKSRPATLLKLPDIITDIATFEDLEQALHDGISYVCGGVALTGMFDDSKNVLPVSPEVGRIGHLLKLLSTGADTSVIVTGIKSDVGLSYRLLQRINSANFAHLNAGASIDQAVMMLGRSELYRWLSLMLFHFAGKRKVSSSLQEVALWRARLLELLAIDRQEPAPAQLFTLGMASMMSPILKISMADVLSILHLHPSAEQALLGHSGPWYEYLQLVSLIEAQSLTDTSPVAESFGGIAHIVASADQAWDWARSAMDTSK